jgi:hypothetical protein
MAWTLLASLLLAYPLSIGPAFQIFERTDSEWIQISLQNRLRAAVLGMLKIRSAFVHDDLVPFVRVDRRLTALNSRAKPQLSFGKRAHYPVRTHLQIERIAKHANPQWTKPNDRLMAQRSTCPGCP